MEKSDYKSSRARREMFDDISHDIVIKEIVLFAEVVKRKETYARTDIR